MTLDPKHVDTALRDLISRLDYDTHKYLECDEDNGEDRYPDLVEEFIGYYKKSEDSVESEDFEEDDEEGGYEPEEDDEEGFGDEDPDYDE